jgi:putative ABC transport system permease protein
MKGQLFTISLVVAAGIAAYVSLEGNWISLEHARQAYYERYRFADVFAHLERAPEAIRRDLEAIEGVARSDTRIVESAMLPLEDMPEPIRAQMISLASEGSRPLNDIHLRDGRRADPGRADEVVVIDSFATAHDLGPGDSLPAVINGKMRELRVVGVAMSPEFVFVIGPGEMSPDPKRTAILWMDRDALAAAYRMEGAFNDAALQLQPGASLPAVLTAVDTVLEPYGGVGSYGRNKQPSNFMLEGELLQLRSQSTVVPVIFLAVAALLLHIVLSRVVHLQRSEIATLKAVGYRDVEVGLHFFKLVMVIALMGAVAGVALGAWLGVELVELYGQYFKLPNLTFRLDLRGAVTAVGINFAAALAGGFSAVKGVIALPPAEAMRPAPPARYRRSIIERLGLSRVVGPASQMIVREIERRPLRTVASALAIAASIALLVVGRWFYDGMEVLLYSQFHEAMREDLVVTFHDRRPERAVREIAHLPGVLHAEGLRAVPVRFRSDHRLRDGTVWGYPEDVQMRRILDQSGRPIALPPDGMVLTDKLAEILDVDVGDRIEVDVLDGERGRRRVVISGLVSEAFGLQGHMQLDALRSWLGEGKVVSMALLRIDSEAAIEVDARLKRLPHVASVSRRSDIFERFRSQSADMILTFTIIVTIFAVTITIGVVYNNARVALSMRSRDLASLRVLGFTRGEISAILLGEMAVQVAVALPFGLLLGVWMVAAMATLVDPETYRLPVIVSTQTHAFAVVVALGASALSALLVRRKLDRLDLIGVLKTRE